MGTDKTFIGAKRVSRIKKLHPVEKFEKRVPQKFIFADRKGRAKEEFDAETPWGKKGLAFKKKREAGLKLARRTH